MDASPAIRSMTRPHLCGAEAHGARTPVRTGEGAVTPEGLLVPLPGQLPCSDFATQDGSWVSWNHSRGVNGPVPDLRLTCGPWDQTHRPRRPSLCAAERFSVAWLCQDLLVCPLGSRSVWLS